MRAFAESIPHEISCFSHPLHRRIHLISMYDPPPSTTLPHNGSTTSAARPESAPSQSTIFSRLMKLVRRAAASTATGWPSEADCRQRIRSLLSHPWPDSVKARLRPVTSHPARYDQVPSIRPPKHHASLTACVDAAFHDALRDGTLAENNKIAISGQTIEQSLHTYSSIRIRSAGIGTQGFPQYGHIAMTRHRRHDRPRI